MSVSSCGGWVVVSLTYNLHYQLSPGVIVVTVTTVTVAVVIVAVVVVCVTLHQSTETHLASLTRNLSNGEK